ncbi:hypothetical protein CMV30_12490 [Nibricoccus aquaticus]|uniref:Glycosyltransferase 2-like domain-containing protein n=1 Tax=Nibricoccus aquaticus TaxID=2576891 RepID=A0A290QK49_9BACT|nr:glycosyltransferase family 2 protein [Nibricoccus aquaticus]ATC64711.1 hypothetical protein CMV30_12490 [Nibricoccus aquaticus]
MKAENPVSPLAVLICGYNQRVYLPDCLEALRAQRQRDFSIYYLDNDSSDGSAEYVETNHPECVVVRLGANLGFAAANNEGMRRAFAAGAEFCVLLNTDTVATPGFLEELIGSYRALGVQGTRVGLVQATVLLHEERDRINTTGNALHYLGYGFCRNHHELHDSQLADRRILSASGAAVLVARTYFETVDGFEDAFFIYNEDQDLSWRGWLLGYTHYVSAKSIVYHKYDYREHPFKMYHSEKNRAMMLVQNYSTRTLCVLLPMLILNEVMISGHALLNGWLGAKLRSYGYVLKSWRPILARRRVIAATRTISDAAIFPMMDSALDFHAYRGVLVRRVVSPLMRAYHRFASLWV